MTERDDYLLDPSAPPDPEIKALERALAPLRFRPLALRAMPPPRPRRWPWLAVAAALLAALGLWAWSRPVADVLQPAASSRTFLATDEPRTIPLGDLAEITLRPGSELTFVHWRSDQALFSLVRGGLTARVEAPPKVPKGFFVIDTRLGRVIDQGCRYELDLRDDGTALVRVLEGAVTFTMGERTVFVPEGASTVVAPWGPSTPCFDNADPTLQKATREFDMLAVKGGDLDQRSGALKEVLAAARTPRDTLVLWHLLRDPEQELREATERHLVDLVGTPVASKAAAFDPEEWLPFLRMGAWQLVK